MFIELNGVDGTRLFIQANGIFEEKNCNGCMVIPYGLSQNGSSVKIEVKESYDEVKARIFAEIRENCRFEFAKSMLEGMIACEGSFNPKTWAALEAIEYADTLLVQLDKSKKCECKGVCGSPACDDPNKKL